VKQISGSSQPQERPGTKIFEPEGGDGQRERRAILATQRPMQMASNRSGVAGGARLPTNGERYARRIGVSSDASQSIGISARDLERLPQLGI